MTESAANPLSHNPAVEWRQTRHGPMMYLTKDAYVGGSLREYGEFSEDEFDLLRQLLKPGDTVVEVGANIGALTIPIARRIGPQGALYAIEAQRRIFQILCANVVLSGMPQVHTLHAAASNSIAPLLVPELDYTGENNFGGISLEVAGTGEKVQTMAVDDLELESCRLLKVDVEGMELDVLRSARGTIQRCRPLLYVENDRQDKSPALLEFIHSQGYRLWWHLPLLYSPHNFAANPVNHFPNMCSVNLVCAPTEENIQFQGFREVTSPQDFPEVGSPE